MIPWSSFTSVNSLALMQATFARLCKKALWTLLIRYSLHGFSA